MRKNSRRPRTFVYDAPHWVCQTCLYVETFRGELAPSPWVEVVR